MILRQIPRANPISRRAMMLGVAKAGTVASTGMLIACGTEPVASPAPASTKAPVTIRFAAAGHGPLAVEVRAEHARLGLGDRFALLGHRDDAIRLLAGADLFVLASGHEGLPVAVMEALALGVPVVATRVGGLPEVVTDGVDGLLVPPGDPAALAAAIRRASRPDERARLAAGAAAAGDRFAAAPAVRRIEAVYDRVRAREHR